MAQEGTSSADGAPGCPGFKELMETNPVLKPYAVRLTELGYDHMDTLKFITTEDMKSIYMPLGHRRLLQSVLGRT